MTAPRSATRTPAKAGRTVLHTKKNSTDDPVELTETSAIITNSALSRTRNSDVRYTLIEELAYQFSEARGFKPGHELEDWLAAEFEVDQRLIREGRAY